MERHLDCKFGANRSRLSVGTAAIHMGRLAKMVVRGYALEMDPLMTARKRSSLALDSAGGGVPIASQ